MAKKVNRARKQAASEVFDRLSGKNSAEWHRFRAALGRRTAMPMCYWRGGSASVRRSGLLDRSFERALVRIGPLALEATLNLPCIGLGRARNGPS